MSLIEALNVIRLYQELHKLLTLQDAIWHMKMRDITELFPIEQQALKIVLNAPEEYYEANV